MVQRGLNLNMNVEIIPAGANWTEVGWYTTVQAMHVYFGTQQLMLKTFVFQDNYWLNRIRNHDLNCAGRTSVILNTDYIHFKRLCVTFRKCLLTMTPVAVKICKKSEFMLCHVCPQDGEQTTFKMLVF